ncbi:MAG: hypothetical protein KGQ50_05335 [Bacteroidetes bacterium]|nr:hypothetical protein [Bacteroidota bacterium]
MINWLIRGRIIGFGLNGKITRSGECNNLYEAGRYHYLTAANPELK